MIAYHWLTETMAAGSGNEPAWTVGEERTYKGRISLCSCGYHSSPTLLQALRYAPGPVACSVEVSEPVAKDNDKQVSVTRKLIAAVNVKNELLTWAADCAERALTRQKEAQCEPDKRSWEAVDTVRRFVAGDATKADVNAAYAAAAYAADAAYDAANAAAYDAANAAAYDAANAAAYAANADAAAYAANAAAYAANAAAYAAAADAAAYAANAAAYAAAADAADAARSEEEAWQRQRFDELVASRLPSPEEVPA